MFDNFQYQPGPEYGDGADWSKIAEQAITVGGGIAEKAIDKGGRRRRRKKKHDDGDASGDGGGIPWLPIGIGVLVLGGAYYASQQS